MSDLEKIATLARDSAQENGRVLPILDDIKAAFADVLPSSQLLPTVSASHPEMSAPSRRSKPRCTAPAATMQARRISPVANDTASDSGEDYAPVSRINFSEAPADSVLVSGA